MAFPLFAPRGSRGNTTPPALSPSGTENVGGVLGERAGGYARGREVAALVLWTASVFFVLALASYVGDPATGDSTGDNWVGPVGEGVARTFVTLLGVTAWSLPVEAALLGIPYVRGRKSEATPGRLAGDLLIVIVVAALVQVGAPSAQAFGAHSAGGAVGELFGELGRSLFSSIGSFLVGFALLGLILIARASFSFIALVSLFAKIGKTLWDWGKNGTSALLGAWRQARALEREEAERARLEAMPRIALPSEDDAIAILPPFEPHEPAEDEPAEGYSEDPADGVRAALAEELEQVVRASQAPVPESPPKASKKRPPRKQAVGVLAEGAPDAACPASAEIPDRSETGGGPAEDVGRAEPPEPVRPTSKRAAEKAEPTIIDTSAALAKEPPPKADAPRKEPRESAKVVPALAEGFRLPPVDFLIAAVADSKLTIDKDALHRSAELLVKTLSDYGVSGKVEDILPGPTVTTFEMSPAAGTKVSKVASLADDLALALAKKVRIVAPIPGKNRIGFELPNDRRIPVNLRDLVEDGRFQTLDVPLPVVLGRDILGAPVYTDLASMPHVIVAGATGAGKSVGLNVMLTSLLYRRTPAELRLLMIDPKVVELAPFDRIPHMLLPVVTDMKQAATALKWAVDEMERRYQLFADAGTKNITTFNNWVDRVVRGEARNPLPKTVVGKDFNGFADEIVAREGDPRAVQQFPERMPYIVIVVDEFADLMMQQGKEVEVSVARLAQKARAAGMHVILATQRPSVDVITGMIKANFPTRCAFRVAQKVDSRTILDEQGAEHLLGRGDMLIKLNGTNETKRVQCPWVSEEEVQKVTDFLRLQGEPVYDENILKPRDDEDGSASEEDAEQDAMYDDAVRLVAETHRCSTSWLQRKLGLGYNRAARIVEMMERRGLVGPANGAKDREVLVDAL